MELPNELLSAIISRYSVQTLEQLIAVFRQRGVSSFWAQELEKLLSPLLEELLLDALQKLESWENSEMGVVMHFLKSRKLQKIIGSLFHRAVNSCSRKKMLEFLELELEEKADLSVAFNYDPYVGCSSLLISGSDSSWDDIRIQPSLEGEHLLFFQGTLKKEVRIPKKGVWRGDPLLVSLVGKLSLLPERYFTPRTLFQALQTKWIHVEEFTPHPTELHMFENQKSFAFSVPWKRRSYFYLRWRDWEVLALTRKKIFCFNYLTLELEPLGLKELGEFKGDFKREIRELKKLKELRYTNTRIICPEITELLGQPLMKLLR